MFCTGSIMPYIILSSNMMPDSRIESDCRITLYKSSNLVTLKAEQEAKKIHIFILFISVLCILKFRSLAFSPFIDHFWGFDLDFFLPSVLVK